MPAQVTGRHFFINITRSFHFIHICFKRIEPVISQMKYKGSASQSFFGDQHSEVLKLAIRQSICFCPVGYHTYYHITTFILTYLETDNASRMNLFTQKSGDALPSSSLKLSLMYTSIFPSATLLPKAGLSNFLNV